MHDADIVISTHSPLLLENSLKTLWPDAMLHSLAERKGSALDKADRERIIKGYHDRAHEVAVLDRKPQEDRFNTARERKSLTESYRRVTLDYALDRLCLD